MKLALFWSAACGHLLGRCSLANASKHFSTGIKGAEGKVCLLVAWVKFMLWLSHLSCRDSAVLKNKWVCDTSNISNEARGGADVQDVELKLVSSWLRLIRLRLLLGFVNFTKSAQVVVFLRTKDHHV